MTNCTNLSLFRLLLSWIAAVGELALFTGLTPRVFAHESALKVIRLIRSPHDNPSTPSRGLFPLDLCRFPGPKQSMNGDRISICAPHIPI